MAERKRRRNVVVDEYPYEESARAILDILRDGSYHVSKGRPDQEPFIEYVYASPEELAEYTNQDGSPDIKSQEKYRDKKRRIVLEQFGAMKLLGFASIKSRTTSASYALTPFGMDALRGIEIMDEANRRGISFTEVWNRLFEDAEVPETEPETA